MKIRSAPPLLLLLLAGCAGYQAGPVNGLTAGKKSIQIALFGNETFEPRLSEALATSLRRAIHRDGTFRLSTSGEGDLIVTGSINDFSRSAVSFQPGDVITPRDVDLTIKAHIVVKERSTGKTVLEADAGGRSTIRTLADQDSATRQAVPLITEDLSRNITALLTEGKWW